jgi:hypothetical protein
MDDFDRFGLEIERECLIRTYQVFKETVGSKEAIRIWRPYCELSGKAIALNLQDWTKEDDVLTKLAKIAVMAIVPYGGECTSLRLVNGELIVERQGCAFLGTVPEICEAYCTITWGAMAKEIDQEIEVESRPGNGRDNLRCITRHYNKTKTLLHEFSNRDFDIKSIMSQISEEEIRWRSHVFSGGVWLMLTCAMVNSIGSEMTLNSLSSHMRRNGSAFGLRIKRNHSLEGSDLDSILNALDIFSRAVLQKQTILSNGPEKIEVQVEECIWSGHDYSTPEHCQLIECINDGICKSINPEYEFRYSSMKTRGDDKCIWTVKKSSAKKGQASESPKTSTEQDPLTLLKIRLAKGEITLEQYEKIAQVLK